VAVISSNAVWWGKIAARVSGAATGCATERKQRPASGVLIGSGFIWVSSRQGRRISLLKGLRCVCERCR
jgi:hypothetical protein